MASLVLSGDTSGAITVSAPAVSGSNTQTLVAVTGTLAPIVAATAQASTSGTSIDFTGIPSWVRRITVMFGAVSTSGSSNFLIQLGDAGGIETTGYDSSAEYGGTAAASSSGAIVRNIGASDNNIGSVVFSLLGSNRWIGFGVIRPIVAGGTGGVCASSKTLSDTLDRVRITTVNGTDTFDNGSINILYE